MLNNIIFSHFAEGGVSHILNLSLTSKDPLICTTVPVPILVFMMLGVLQIFLQILQSEHGLRLHSLSHIPHISQKIACLHSPLGPRQGHYFVVIERILFCGGLPHFR